MHPVKIGSPQLTLREFRLNDVDVTLRLVGDDRVTSWLSFDSRNRDQTSRMIECVIKRAQYEPRTEYYLAITLGDDTLVGFVRLGLDGVQAAKLGYAIAADYWGRGYASDAARLIVDFGFRKLALHRISAAIGPDNAPSIAVAQRLGMSYEGTIRHHVFTNGFWRDSLLYSVLEDDWITK